MDRMWAGVDVGGRRKGFDVALIDGPGHLVLLDRYRTVELVVEALSHYTPVIVAVDSPRTPAPAGEKSREGERQLVRSVCGIRYTPDKATLESNPRYYEWIQHGFELYAALELAGMPVTECFPTASWTRLSGPRGAVSRARWTSRGLAQLQVAGLPARLNQDGRDAIVAALTARRAALGTVERFGDIVVPSEAGFCEPHMGT